MRISFGHSVNSPTGKDWFVHNLQEKIFATSPWNTAIVLFIEIFHAHCSVQAFPWTLSRANYYLPFHAESSVQAFPWTFLRANIAMKQIYRSLYWIFPCTLFPASISMVPSAKREDSYLQLSAVICGYLRLSAVICGFACPALQFHITKAEAGRSNDSHI